MLTALTGLVRLYLATPEVVEPYVALGVSLSTAYTGTSNVSLSGFGFSGGAGLDFNLNEEVTIGIKTLYRGIYLTTDHMQAGLDVALPEESSFMNMITASAHIRLNL